MSETNVDTCMELTCVRCLHVFTTPVDTTHESGDCPTPECRGHWYLGEDYDDEDEDAEVCLTVHWY